MVFCLLSFALSSSQVFDAAVAAHSHLMKGDVSVHVETKLKSVATRTDARLRFVEPDRLSLDVREPQQNGQASSSRSYNVSGTRFVAVDNNEGEYTSREVPFPARLALADRLTATVGNPGDAISTLLSPQAMEKFFSSFRVLKDLKASQVGNLIVLKRAAGRAKVEFDFGASDHLLRKVRLDNGAGYLLWTYGYSSNPATLPSPRIAGLRRVESLTVRGLPPKYKSPAAKELARKCEKAYANLQSVECQFGGPDGVGYFTVSGKSFRQDMGGSRWAFSGRQLWMQTANELYASRTTLVKVPTLVEKARGQVQPMLLQIMEGRNPMGTLLVSESTVRLAGELKIGGAPAAILEIHSKGLDVNVTVRRADGMILLTRTKVMGKGGEVTAREENTYHYSSVNKAVPGATFKMPSGTAKAFPK